MAEEVMDDTTQADAPDTTALQDAVTPPATATPPDTAINAPISPVKPDGSFIDNWRDLLPEDIKGEECLKLVPNFNEMAKQFVNQRKAIGKNKVAIPNDKSDQSEWDSFYTAIGRPKSADAYTTPETPEEMKEIYNDAAMARAKEFAFKIGATQKQLNDFIAFDVASKQQTIAEQEEFELKQTRIAKENAEKELRTEFGMAYDERMHAANRLITEAIDKESERLKFIENYGNDVNIIRLLSNIGARMAEHTALIGELTHKTPTEVQERINAIQNNPDYRNINSKMTPQEREQLTIELQGLFKQLYPQKKG